MTLILNKSLQKELRLLAGCWAITPYLQSMVTRPFPGGGALEKIRSSGAGKSPGYEVRHREAELLTLSLASISLGQETLLVTFTCFMETSQDFPCGPVV